MANRYLVVPSPPTPNGRLHLGHMAGVYLPLDILTRTLRQQGHSVFFLGGSDAYDSYVASLAADEAERRCRVLDLHSGIAQDLKLLAIEMDGFSCPMDSRWQALYLQVQSSVLNALERQGKVLKVAESYLEEIGSGSVCSGAKLVGQCPCCMAALRGFICEGCGAINAPEALIKPGAASGRPTLPRQHISRFLKLSGRTRDALTARVDRHFASSAIAATPKRFLVHPDALVRLTCAGDFGLSLEGFSPAEKVFNYSAFADYVFAGELYKQLTGDSVNPFERDSGFITVGMCGFDNVLSSLVFESAVAQESQIWKCIDYPLVSGFLTFEGSKFSTSRKHGIWGHELLSCEQVDPDVLRYCLATVSPEGGSSDFSVQRYIDFSNTGAGRALYRSIQRADGILTAAGQAGPLSIDNVQDLIPLLPMPGTRPDLNGFSVSAIVAGIDRWVMRQAARMADPQGALAYLYGLAILAYPVLPGVSRTLWDSLGLTGLPRLMQSPLSLCYRARHWSLPLLEKADIAFSIHQMQDAE